MHHLPQIYETLRDYSAVELFMYNYENASNRYRISHRSIGDTPLDLAFSWEDTPEGHTFWRELHYILKGLQCRLSSHNLYEYSKIRSDEKDTYEYW